MTKAEEHLRGMLATDIGLYERILDTPVFAYHFNELVKLAMRKEPERVDLAKLWFTDELYRMLILWQEHEEASSVIYDAAQLLKEPKQHVWFKCRPDCEKLHCPYCEGGLGYCVVCTAAEGELRKVCPGYALTPEEKERDYRGT